jgi:hypothetical protein
MRYHRSNTILNVLAYSVTSDDALITLIEDRPDRLSLQKTDPRTRSVHRHITIPIKRVLGDQFWVFGHEKDTFILKNDGFVIFLEEKEARVAVRHFEALRSDVGGSEISNAFFDNKTKHLAVWEASQKSLTFFIVPKVGLFRMFARLVLPEDTIRVEVRAGLLVCSSPASIRVVGMATGKIVKEVPLAFHDYDVTDDQGVLLGIKRTDLSLFVAHLSHSGNALETKDRSYNLSAHNLKEVSCLRYLFTTLCHLIRFVLSDSGLNKSIIFDLDPAEAKLTVVKIVEAFTLPPGISIGSIFPFDLLFAPKDKTLTVYEDINRKINSQLVICRSISRWTAPSLLTNDPDLPEIPKGDMVFDQETAFISNKGVYFLDLISQKAVPHLQFHPATRQKFLSFDFKFDPTRKGYSVFCWTALANGVCQGKLLTTDDQNTQLMSLGGYRQCQIISVSSVEKRIALLLLSNCSTKLAMVRLTTNLVTNAVERTETCLNFPDKISHFGFKSQKNVLFFTKNSIYDTHLYTATIDLKLEEPIVGTVIRHLPSGQLGLQLPSPRNSISIRQLLPD